MTTQEEANNKETQNNQTEQSQNNQTEQSQNNQYEKQKEDSKFWDEAKENVSEGAKVVGEEAKRIGEKITAYSDKIFGKISDSASDAYKISTEFTRDAVNSAQGLAEKYKDQYDVNRLNNKKKEFATQLGMKLYLDVKNNNNEISDNFLDENDIKGLISKLEEIDQEIIQITKEEEEKK